MESGEKDFERILMLETSPAVFVEKENNESGWMYLAKPDQSPDRSYSWED